nr:immunoglobulin light chain junction region [Macaca mulatta]
DYYCQVHDSSSNVLF